MLFHKNPATVYLLVLVIIVAAYWKVFHAGFISDDWPMIAENPYLRSVESIPGYFTSGVWSNSKLQTEDSSLYRPMYLIFYFTIYTVAGANPFWFHFALLLVHVANSFLVLLILKRLFPEMSLIELLAGTVIFALHPAQTQAVAWVSGGTDVVMAFFILAGFLCYLKNRTQSGSFWGYSSTVFFTTALLVKETAVIFPVLLWAFDLFKEGSFRRSLKRHHAINLALLLIYIFIRSRIVDATGLSFSGAGFFRVVEQITMTFRFILMPWPLPFYFRYPANGIAEPFDFITGTLVILILAVLFFKNKQSRFGIIWLILVMLPTLSVAFHAQGVFALRFLYLSIAGLVIAVLSFFETMTFKRPYLIIGIGLAVTAIFFTGTVLGVNDWIDEAQFYSKVVEANPGSLSGYEGLGRYYSRIGNNNAAISVYQRGLRNVIPEKDRTTLMKITAKAYADSGRYSESLSLFQALNRLSPGSDSLLGIGNNLWMLKRLDEALATYRKAIKADPKNSLALANYAQLSASMGRTDEARKYYMRVLQINPENADPAAMERARAFMEKTR